LPGIAPRHVPVSELLTSYSTTIRTIVGNLKSADAKNETKFFGCPFNFLMKFFQILVLK